MLDNPNVRAFIQSVVPGVLAALALLQQDAGTQAAIIGGLVVGLGQLLALYGTPISKTVGVGKEPLNAEGEPVA